MIELRHLRYFIAVAEELNFRRAAERIHIDQTPLSRTIRDLEERLGVMLFVRSPRKLRLTPAGAKLLEQARRLLIRLERTKRVVRETDARHCEPLRIGTDDCTAQPKLAECLARWQTVAAGTPVELTEMRSTELLVALRSEEVDIGFSFGLPDDAAIAQLPAWASPLVALLPHTHELARRDVISLAELLSFPTIVYHADYHSGLSRQMEDVLKRYALHPTIVGEARSLAGYLTRVAAGLGVGMADADHMRALQRSDVVVVPIGESIHLTTYVLHKLQPTGLHESLRRFLTHATTSH